MVDRGAAHRSKSGGLCRNRPPTARPCGVPPRKRADNTYYIVLLYNNGPYFATKADTTLKKRHPFCAGGYSAVRGARVAQAGPQPRSSMLTWSAQQQRPSRWRQPLSSQWISVSGEVGWLSVATLPYPRCCGSCRRRHPGAGMADVDAVQAAAARLVVAAVILGTVKIAHKNTSMSLVCAGAEVFMRFIGRAASAVPAHRRDFSTRQPSFVEILPLGSSCRAHRSHQCPPRGRPEFLPRCPPAQGSPPGRRALSRRLSGKMSG